jgi:hypothetical protein
VETLKVVAPFISFCILQLRFVSFVVLHETAVETRNNAHFMFKVGVLGDIGVGKSSLLQGCALFFSQQRCSLPFIYTDIHLYRP